MPVCPQFCSLVHDVMVWFKKHMSYHDSTLVTILKRCLYAMKNFFLFFFSFSKHPDQMFNKNIAGYDLVFFEQFHNSVIFFWTKNWADILTVTVINIALYDLISLHNSAVVSSFSGWKIKQTSSTSLSLCQNSSWRTLFPHGHPLLSCEMQNVKQRALRMTVMTATCVSPLPVQHIPHRIPVPCGGHCTRQVLPQRHGNRGYEGGFQDHQWWR